MTSKFYGWGVVVIVIIILLMMSVGTVSAGSVGVETRFGKVIGEKGPGVYVIMPFLESVTAMDTQIQKDQSDATAASNDLQEVTATVAVNYHINAGDVDTLYQNIGTNYADRIIAPAIQESVKSVVANYTAEELITKRETVRGDILKLLTTKLTSVGIQVDSLNIVNFAFSNQFNTAIEAKVTAQQNALTAENQVAQAQAQASSTIISAEAQAKAIEIQAEAINSQGGADYVELQAVAKWNGVLPAQFVPGSALPFLGLTTK